MRRSAGFTLLELLIALSLLALIGVALAGSAGMGVQVWKRAETLPAADEEAILRSHLRDWIERAKPTNFAPGRRQIFIGTPERIQLITMDQVRISPDLGEARISLEISRHSDGTQDLILVIEILAHDGEVIALDRRRFVKDASEIRFRYFDARNRDADGWSDDWQAQRRLPDLISIEIDRPKDPWPPLVVAPRLG